MKIRTTILFVPVIILIITILGTAAYSEKTDFVSCWHFDEGGGDTVYDSSCNNEGIIHGATWTEGISGYALSFDGNNDYVEVPDDPALQIEGDLTIELWTLPGETQDSGFLPLVAKNRPGNTGYGYGIWMIPDNTFYATIGHSIGPEKLVFLNTPLTSGEWNHVVVINDDENQNMIYINGVLANVTDDPTGLKADTYPFVIGGDSHSSRKSFTGIIDEVCIYDRVLTESEIQSHYTEDKMAVSGGVIDKTCISECDLTPNEIKEFCCEDNDGLSEYEFIFLVMGILLLAGIIFVIILIIIMLFVLLYKK